MPACNWMRLARPNPRPVPTPPHMTNVMTTMHPDWLIPAWKIPGVGALMTTRQGGVSAAPFDSLNLRDGIGDDPASVKRNQALLADAIGATPVFLNQVHGAHVVHLLRADMLSSAPVHTGDASFTTELGIACTVQVADCLPVLFAAPQGRAVGAAHAGWRGLALGVLEATLAAVCQAGRCAPDDIQVWLGASIGPHQFEVGEDVLAAFSAANEMESSGHVDQETARRAAAGLGFVPLAPGKWLANLPHLAKSRLFAAGVRSISGGDWCTVENPSHFFSFRRDRVTGRMVAAIWRVPHA